jgi:endothelin-converting enzyme/putative endopeptidase
MRKIRMVATVLSLVPGAALWAAPPPAADASAAGFQLGDLDRRVEPCQDFYRFACGGWLAKNPTPPDQPEWGRFDVLQDQNRATLRTILEAAAAGGSSQDPVDRKIGDYYASCMDEKAIEAKGLAALQTELGPIDALRDKAALADEVAALQVFGADVLLNFDPAPDQDDAGQTIGEADQGGLGLPDRDDYFRDDAHSAEVRKAYVAHIAKTFGLAGDTPEVAAARAKTVMEIETGIAKVSLDTVSRRDPQKVHHKMTRAELVALTPSFDWSRYLRGVQAPAFERLNVAVPDFFRGLEPLITRVSLADWKSYLRWRALQHASPLLPKAFVEANFQFYGQVLQGLKEESPRWKRCVTRADEHLGEALGRRYVERTFGETGKERMAVMVKAIEDVLQKDIQELPWMGDATRKQALIKLAAISNKVGYPERWRDYGTLQVVRGDALGNARRADGFEFGRQIAKIGKPTDRSEWLMTPPTVNAYYEPPTNSINFPAGILQPPFFDTSLDDAMNFGAIGAFIGHELTHGFDDQGRQYDEKGNIRDWWTAADAAEFDKRASCIVDQYSGYTAVDDVKVNGKLTLGENVADGGGIRIAHLALAQVLGEKQPAPIDGFTTDQRFFLGWARVWCENSTDEFKRLLAQTNPHAPAEDRVNGALGNMPEFQQAFACKAGTPMVRENVCRVW